MKKQYITPTATIFVCQGLQLLYVSNVDSNVNINWGGADNSGLESDARFWDLYLDDE